jgi:hypothetical protein
MKLGVPPILKDVESEELNAIFILDAEVGSEYPVEGIFNNNIPLAVNGSKSENDSFNEVLAFISVVLDNKEKLY